MQCNCVSEVEEKLKARALEALNIQDAESLSINLDKMIVMEDLTPAIYTYSTAEVTFTTVSKTGNIRQKTIKQKVQHSYCPFCGQPTKKPEATK